MDNTANGANEQQAFLETLKNNAATSTSDAARAQNSAEQADASAKTANDNALSSTAHAQKTKDNAEASTLDAETTKNNAEVSTQAANVVKTNTDNSIEQARIAGERATEATAAAETAKNNAENSATDAQKAKDSAQSSETDAANAKSNFSEIAEELAKATTARNHAEKEARAAAQAHNMSTTVGLAGAFNKKAIWATVNQYIWVGILIISLFAIGAVAWFRFGAISTIIHDMIVNDKNLLEIVGVEIVLSGLGLGAPIWLAWISSKMISRYFHLSQDYSYKAAIAQAYLGFKEQASGLDPIFQERLFAAAITQLDSNPLRFFNSSSDPGSPLQDLLNQPFMQAALDDKSFNNGMTSWMKRVFKTNFFIPKWRVKAEAHLSNDDQPTEANKADAA